MNNGCARFQIISIFKLEFLIGIILTDQSGIIQNST